MGENSRMRLPTKCCLVLRCLHCYGYICKLVSGLMKHILFLHLTNLPPPPAPPPFEKTPYQPHAIGYVSDISKREDAPAHQSWLGAFGYYLGLFAGFVVALLIYVAAGGQTGHTEEEAKLGKNGKFTGNFIPISFIVAIVVIAVGLVFVSKMDESIPKAKQEENKKKQR
jgi:MFS family permease